MLSKLKNSEYLKHSIWAFGGQLAFLLANFLLFILLINRISQDLFGVWALYITLISVADSIRQGIVQNGLTRLIIANPKDSSLISTGALLNFGFSALLGLLALLYSLLLSAPEYLNDLLPHAWKSLLVLGVIQFISTLCQASKQFKTYCITNLLYLISFISLLAYMLSTSTQISLVQIINIQMIALVLPLIYFLSRNKLSVSLPRKAHFSSLIDFGKYSAGTNILSILFHKADILMIAYFLDPGAVALFHFASKIMSYAELPLHALSQVIYPRLSASYRAKEPNQLNREYGMSIIRLLVFVIPIAIVVIMFNQEIINILSSGEYNNSSQLIIILGIGIIFKPWGRVFGLTLDAIGKPQVNFKMLLISLFINITMNLILIPIYGLQGAALATTSSIIITILIGQFNINGYAAIKPITDITDVVKDQLTQLKLQLWN